MHDREKTFRANLTEHSSKSIERSFSALKYLKPSGPMLTPAPVLVSTFVPVASPNPATATVAPNPALQAQVNQLLLHVARGEQEAAEVMASSNPSLLLHKGQVTDYSNRTFNTITAFQYALWAYDWHMWKMLRSRLPQPVAKEQIKDLESNSTEHAKHYNYRELLQSLQTYVDNYLHWRCELSSQH
ncbi:MAG: hypothetical protein EXR81_04525 [Gammaproteobacteria bacterium]|nr:hypothetical protein [Gammaproteobacteria bacterium]